MRLVSALQFVVVAGVTGVVATASAQAPYPGDAGYPNSRAGYSQYTSEATPTRVQPTNFERKTGRNNPALNFFGAPKSSQHVAKPMRSVQAPPPVAVNTKPMGKPFSSYRASSTITPYLGLDYFDDSVGLPNYYMFVRPQLDQNHVNSEQRVDNRTMRAGLRQANAGGAVARPAGGIPTTGHSSQFMNGGGYFPTYTR